MPDIQNGEHPDYSKYIGLAGPVLSTTCVLERDVIRRFTQAIMDTDPHYYDEAVADASRYGGICAPPLFPVHMLRRAPGTPDPLDSVRRDPMSDGTEGSESLYLGLPPIETPFKRLLNGGAEIEFYSLLELGRSTTVQARYVDVSLKRGSSGEFVSFVIEARYQSTSGELLLVNRRNLIWR